MYAGLSTPAEPEQASDLLATDNNKWEVFTYIGMQKAPTKVGGNLFSG